MLNYWLRYLTKVDTWIVLIELHWGAIAYLQIRRNSYRKADNFLSSFTPTSQTSYHYLWVLRLFKDRLILIRNRFFRMVNFIVIHFLFLCYDLKALRMVDMPKEFGGQGRLYLREMSCIFVGILFFYILEYMLIILPRLMKVSYCFCKYSHVWLILWRHFTCSFIQQ